MIAAMVVGMVAAIGSLVAAVHPIVLMFLVEIADHSSAVALQTTRWCIFSIALSMSCPICFTVYKVAVIKVE